MRPANKSQRDYKGWILIGVILFLLILTIFSGRFFRSENKLTISFQNNYIISSLFAVYDDQQKIINSFVLFFSPKSNRFKTYISFVKNNKTVFLTIENAVIKGISKEEIKNAYSRLLGTKINYYLFIKDKDLVKYIDLIGGLTIESSELSIPDKNIYYPSGILRLDGDKVLEYLTLEASGENKHESLKRSETICKSLLVPKEDIGSSFSEKMITDYFYQYFVTNLSMNDVLIFYRQVALRYQQSNQDFSNNFIGTILYCDKDIIDDLVIYLPKQSGNWIRSDVKASLEQLDKIEIIDKTNVINIELLNGTDIVGFANRTKHYLESFGFKINEIGNAEEQDYKKTTIIIQNSELKALKLAELIRCTHIKKGETTNSSVDVTLILGRDFDGKLVK